MSSRLDTSRPDWGRTEGCGRICLGRVVNWKKERLNINMRERSKQLGTEGKKWYKKGNAI